MCLSIDGLYFSAVDGATFCLPRPWDAPSTIVTDMFALGLTTYEIMTSTQLFAGQTDMEVKALFKEVKFPAVDSIPCGQLIEVSAQLGSFGRRYSMRVNHGRITEVSVIGRFG